MSRSRKICLILGLIVSWIIGYLLFREPNQVLLTPDPQFLAQNWLILGGNSVKAINIPFYPKTAVYGQILFAFGSDLEWDLEELVKKDDLIYCLIQKESNGNPKARGKAGEIGILQFLPKTFDSFSKRYGLELDINNPEHQIFLALKMLKENQKNIYQWSTAKKCLKSL